MTVLLRNPLGGIIGLPVISGTPGSVLFIDASGNLGQNNPGFTYDSTTQTLFIGLEGKLGNIVAPDATITNGYGGFLNFQTGAGNGSGNGGDFIFQTGNSIGSGDGGQITGFAGNGGLTGQGGAFTFNGGDGGTVSGHGGSVTFVGGRGRGGNSNGGSVEFDLGSAHGAGTNGVFQIIDGGTSNGVRLNTSLLTAPAGSRIQSFPDASGTFALTSDLANVAYVNQANSFTVSPQTITADADTHKGLIVKAHSGTQSANLQEWQNSGGSPVVDVTPEGYIVSTSGNPGTQHYTISSINTTFGTRTVGFFWYGNGAEGGIQASGQMNILASGLIQIVPSGASFGMNVTAVTPVVDTGSGATDISLANQVGTFLFASTNQNFTAFAAQGAPSMVKPLSQWRQISSTSTARTVGIVDAVFISPTDASYTGRLVLKSQDFNGTREGVRIDSNGSAALLGFFGHTAAVQPSAYTPTNVTTDRSYDANSTTIDEIADVLGTLIADLQTMGLVA